MVKVRETIIKVLNGMAWGLFSSLLIGLILRQIGLFFKLDDLVTFGNMAQRVMGPAIAIGVGYALGSTPLVLASLVAVGAIGAGTFQIQNDSVIAVTGEPVGALIASWVAAEIGNRLSNKTKVDIVFIPLVTILTGGFIGLFISPYIVTFMNTLGSLINTATTLQPFLMGIIVSVIMGMVLTLPISSAALAISLNLTGLAAGAATVGCCANMIGFAIASFKDNGWGGLLAQGIGTSMLQVPNIIKKPIIWLPAIIASAILGPISTVVLKMTSNAIGAGMGTSGLVGQVAMIEVMGSSPSVYIQIAFMHFILPAIIAYSITKMMRRLGWIHVGDMKLANPSKK